jgi:hypothetical protein
MCVNPKNTPAATSWDDLSQSNVRVRFRGVARKLLDGLHGSDWVQFVPSVDGVGDMGAPDEIALADLRLKIGSGVWFAGLDSVGLRYFSLAYRFEDQVALLT